MQHKTERNSIDKFLLVLKGIAMGAANKVPGVSGGVVAFVAGFYEEFIYSLKKFNFKAFRLLIGFRFKSFWQYINGSFLGFIILGMLISYFSISQLIDFMLDRYEINVWSLFFGMIIGSLIYIVKGFEESWSFKNIGFVILGTIAGIAITHLSPEQENDNLLFVFFCGIISVSGMTLPGLSGSFILILLGNYVLLLVDSVNALYNIFPQLLSFNFSFWYDTETRRLITVLLVFTLGSMFGLVSLSHVLSAILKKHKAATFACIIGFILGSLSVVWPWKQKIFKQNSSGNTLLDANGNPILDHYNSYMPQISNNTWVAIGWIVFGIIIVLYLEWLANGRKNRSLTSKNRQ